MHCKKCLALKLSAETDYSRVRIYFLPIRPLSILHVKGTFIGLNGTVINYDFDIGEISKSIKAIAEKNGFKFKTVIRRKSALFRAI